MGLFHSAKCRLLSMLCLTFFFFLVEIVVGYVTNSTALIADSFHMLSDVVALVIAYVSVRMSPKKWSKNTFGWARAEVLGALINAVFLLALCFSILIESFKRFVDPEKLHNPLLILGVGIVGLLVNVIGLFLFHEGHGHSHGGATTSSGHIHVPSQEVVDTIPGTKNGTVVVSSSASSSVPNGDGSKHPDHDHPPPPKRKATRNMNMHGVFLHVLADALGSVIVIISALVVYYFDKWEGSIYVDPILSVIMVVIIAHTTLPLLTDSALILLQTVPTHIQIDSLQRKLLQEIDGVLAVHEFHVWQLAGDRIIASAHIRCRNLHDYMQIAEQVKEFFHNEGIHSTTIQPEFVEIEETGQGTIESSSVPGGSVVVNGEDQWQTGSGSNSTSGLRSRVYNLNDANCVLDCPSGRGSDSCLANTCCGPQQRRSPNVNSDGEDMAEISAGAAGVLRRNARRLLTGGSSKTDKAKQRASDADLFDSVKVLSDSSSSSNSGSSSPTKHLTAPKLQNSASDNVSNYSSSSTGSHEKLNVKSNNGSGSSDEKTSTTK